MRHKWKYNVCAILCLIVGALVYVVFRNDVLFLKLLGVQADVEVNIAPSLLSQFILYNLSDTLWALSLMLFLSTQTNRVVRFCGLMLPIVMESLQAFRSVPGVFDFVDLLIYILISITFYKRWKRKREL